MSSSALQHKASLMQRRLLEAGARYVISFLIIELVDQRDPIEVVLQRTLDEVADSALLVAQTGVGIWKGGLQKADDQVGIGDFHAIDRDERHLSTTDTNSSAMLLNSAPFLQRYI